MDFNIFCKHLERISFTKTHQDKTKLLKSLFQSIKKHNYNSFSHLRLILPDYDRERPSYRIKESKLVQILTKTLNLTTSQSSQISTQILKASTREAGNIVYSIIKKYFVTKGDPTFTVDCMNAQLDRIANRKDTAELETILRDIFKKTTPEGIKWFIQILLKNVRLGIGHNQVLNCYHEDGGEFYKSTSSLQKLAETLNDPQKRLNEILVGLFEPFVPMLSQRIDGGNFRKYLSDNTMYFIENKFDGERFQVHMKNGEFKYFSRNGYNFTQHFGEGYDSNGILTPRLRNAFNSDVHSFILDGEMMLWNKKTSAFGSKGLEYDVKNMKKDGKYQPCFCVFDILLLNDKVLSNQPLQDRLEKLDTVLKRPIQGTILISEKNTVCSLQEIVDQLNESIEKNEEGIVVKQPISIYKFGDRKSGWFKMKMDYFDDVVHDLDLLMMGATYGRTNNSIASVFFGLKSSASNYTVMGRITSGLKAEQLDQIFEKFQLHGRKENPSPQSLIFGKDKPEVYILPKNSILLQIRASEMVRATSDTFRTPYTLRFARVLRLRDDKPVDQCMTLDELLELTARNKGVIKLNKSSLKLEEIQAAKRARSTRKKEVEVVLLSQSISAGTFLKSKKIYVYSGLDTWPIEEIRMAVKRGGGENVLHFHTKIDILLTGKVDEKIRGLMKGWNNYHIVLIEWFKRVLNERKLVDFQPKELLYYSRSFDNDLSTNIDVYGDSFTGKTTKEELQTIFALMDQREDSVVCNLVRCAELNLHTKFENYCVYFDRYEEPNNADSSLIYDSFLDEFDFKYYKGRVSDLINEDVNLIITKDKTDRIRILNDFLAACGFLTNNIEIVENDFINS